MKLLFKNEDVRRAVLKTSMFLVILACLFSVLTVVSHRFLQQLWLQQAIKIQATFNITGQVNTFFQGETLSTDILNEMTRLETVQFVPKNIPNLFGAISSAFFALWCSIAIFITVTLLNSYYTIYKRIANIQQFTMQFFSDDTPIDIRHFTSGVLSTLESDLYHLSTSLKTKLYTNKQQKAYLAKNLADISHQLKTPLTALLVVTDTLLALPVSQRTDEKLLQLEPQLVRIEQLIQQLLVLTRIDANVLTLSLETINVNELVSTIATQLAVLMQQKHIRLNQQTTTIHLQADKFFLTEALSNVLKNAIEHTFENGEITISYDDNIFMSTISIHNTGQPIDKDDLPYIFQRFYRGKNAPKTSVGIGLSLAYEIIEKHRGKLSVENTSQGVKFTFSLPK